MSHDIVNLKNVTILRGEGFTGEEVVVSNCKGCFIYLLTKMKKLKITDCEDTLIVAGVVQDALMVEKSLRIHVITITKNISILKTRESVFNLCVNNPPLIHNSKNITLAPYNSSYPEILVHIKDAKVETSWNKNLWDSPKQYSNSSDILIESPEQFHPFVIPFTKKNRSQPSQEENPCELSAIYLSSVDAKIHRLSELQNKLARKRVSEEFQKALQNTIESKFQEWLEETHNLRQLQSLLKLEKRKS
jgi:hypothetical protein